MERKMFLNPIFCIVLMLGMKRVSTVSDWTDSLKNQVKETIKPFQVMFLIKDDMRIQDPGIVDMIRKIDEVVPTWKFRFNNQTMQDVESQELLKPLENPRSTTLFVIIHFPSNDLDLRQLRHPVEFMIGISPIRSRPKCLLLLSTRNKSLSYKKLLRFMWSQHFLDATVLEIIDNLHGEAPLLKNWNVQPDPREVVAKASYYNPFTKSFTEEKYSSRTRLFPNKLKDMHGYEMKAALVESSRFSYVKRNRTGHLIEAHGPDFLMSEALSSKMNFSISFTPSLNERWGIFNCDKTKTTGPLYNLSHNEIQFIGNLVGISGQCRKDIAESTMKYDYLQVVVLIPDTRNEQISYLDLWKCALPVILIILITVIVQAIEKRLEFEAPFRYWHYILQPLIGVGMDQTPRKLAEKIVFACLLITGMTYISSIFSSLTEANIQVESKIEIKDLHDLYQSELNPVMNPSMYKFIEQNSDETQRQILQKALKSNSTDEDCFDKLEQNKNIACIMRLQRAQTILANSMKRDVATILKEPLLTVLGCIQMEPATPYVDRFDEIIQGVIQSGLYEKWKDDFSVNATSEMNSDESERDMLSSPGIFSQVMILMITGYIVSFLVFLGELVLQNWSSLKRIWNRIWED